MNYNDILKLSSNDVVDSVSGKVIGVYLKEPTPAQKNKGIHVQEVVLQNDDGDKIRLRINSAGMHLDPQDARGRQFKFESAPNEKGKLSGLAANVFNGNTTINVYKDAIITGDRSNGQVPPSGAYKPAQEVSLSKSVGRVDLDDHVATIVSLVKKVDEQMDGTEISETTPEVYSDFLVRLATTVYIQCCKDNLIKKRETYEPVKLVDGRPVGKTYPSVSEIVDLALKGELTAEQFQKYDELGQYNWEEIYDEVEERLVKLGHDRDSIAAAFDDTKAHYIKRTKNFSSPEFLKVVLTDVPTFIGAVETAHEGLLQPEATKSSKKTDDIPF